MAFQTGGPPPAPVPAAVAPATDTGPPSDAKRPKQGDSAVAGLIYNGRKGDLNVRIPRFDNEIDVDGTLSAPVWQQAALLNGFSEYFPVDGRAASDSTEVFVWYSATAIYFGIRAFETHGAVHATLANRDLIDGDDNVQLILTPFVHGRHALMLAVNPFGVQEDGTITEGVLATGYNVAATGPPPVDLSADFVYESKGHLTSYGYEVVMRIPFRSFKYQQKDPQDWGLNIIRNVQHLSEMDTWVPTRIAAASFLAQSGTLVGLTGLERGLVLDLNPIVTEKALGYPGPAGSGNPASGPAPWIERVERPQFGGNVRWGVTPNLTFAGTFRPDFAEVESDATQLQYDPRQAIQYPEKRPFFLEGIDQFSVPNNVIYTRQISAPIGAVKLTGKVGDFNVAYLGALDDEGNPFAAGGGHPMFNVLRTLTDVGEASQIGFVATDKEDGGSFNRVVGVDTRFTWDKIYSTGDAGSDELGTGEHAVHHRYPAGKPVAWRRADVGHAFRAGRSRARPQLRSERHRSRVVTRRRVCEPGGGDDADGGQPVYDLLRTGRVSPDDHTGFHISEHLDLPELHRWRSDRRPEVPLLGVRDSVRRVAARGRDVSGALRI